MTDQLLNSLPAQLRRAFTLMAVAEEEIAAAQGGQPEAIQDMLHQTFGLLYPGILAPFSDQLYRAHVRELLARVVAGQDTRPGTDAEVVACLSATSLAAPMRGWATCLYVRLFRHTLPDMAAALDIDEDAALERLYAREADEEDAVIRAKLTNPARHLTG